MAFPSPQGGPKRVTYSTINRTLCSSLHAVKMIGLYIRKMGFELCPCYGLSQLQAESGLAAATVHDNRTLVDHKRERSRKNGNDSVQHDN